MDQLTRTLMLGLEGNGLQPYHILAHRYGVSEVTIRRRLHDMVSENLVRMIAADNFILLGYRAWASIGIKVRLGFLHRVAQSLVEDPLIYFVAYTTGRYDLLIRVCFRTIDELAHFINSKLARMSGIISTEAIPHVVPRRYTFFNWPAPDTSRTSRGEAPASTPEIPPAEYKLDKTDRAILDALKREGPARPKQLAAKLGVGEHTVRKHLKTLEKNEVYKIEILPLLDIGEYTAQATIGINNAGQHPNKIMESLLEHKEVYLASLSLGRYNMVIAARFPNPNLLNDFITKTLPQIPGVNSVETHLHAKRIKYRNLTWPIP